MNNDWPPAPQPDSPGLWGPAQPVPSQTRRSWATPGQNPPSWPVPARPARRRGLLRRLGRAACYVLIVLLTLDLVAEVCFVGLNWVNPPVTAFMLEDGGGNLHDYVDLKYVSRYMAAATLAHEDAQLPTRFTGLDWGQWWSRATSFLTGAKDPYGSPIPEQLSKNLLLWPHQDPIRKTADAVLAEQLVHAVSKQRVLELYLNEAQFGPHIYGICDASWYYFGEAPDYMSYDDSYQLMGVLPGPDHAHRAPGGGIEMTSGTPDANWEAYYIAGARRWVPLELQTDGWQKLVQAVGLTGSAHAEPNGPGDCRTMPQDIHTLIASGR